MAGYPHITVPLDYIDGLPIGMSFIGTAWSDKQLIEYAYSFEELNNFNPKPKL
jgi:Asp-tRNA(Asn)/Glu-tRNA(Gln) amidotransferase A subunit family amidase